MPGNLSGLAATVSFITPNRKLMLNWLYFSLFALLELAFLSRALLRPYRDPASRLAWVVVILVLPVAGMIAYLLFGETNIGRRRIARMRAVTEALPPELTPAAHACDVEALIPTRAPLFHVGQSINGHAPTTGNRATLMDDSEATIDAMVADIDAAEEHVHVLFYIWLADTSGLQVIEALKRAARRGVTCRAMADHIGSWRLMRSRHWRDMDAAGVKLARAMRLRPLRARMDMRNHRKIVVVDNRITYCGSQNCADAAFVVKARFAPWVDIMLRFEGPVAMQNQRLFAIDWMTARGENLAELFEGETAPPAAQPGFVAQVIGTSAAVRYTAMPEMFIALIGNARRELVLTTPYYVPDEAIQLALCSAAERGVEVRAIFPARNDSLVVAAASHSYYRDLLAAGAHIHEFTGGMLHAKTVTVDGEVALVGSANLDSRSFDLNSENNILLADRDTTAAIRARQQDWLASTREVTLADVQAWPWLRRLWNNTVAMSGPLL